MRFSVVQIPPPEGARRTRRALLLALALLAGCAPLRDNALYMVDGVRMEITRDRTIVDTSAALPLPQARAEGSVTLGPTPVSRGMLIRRADGAVVTEADRARADAAFRLYCAARGEDAPLAPLIFDRPSQPTGFFGLCRRR